MIKKIGNWVFGSFFRTAGRLLFFIILGFIIASIIKSNDISINWTDLIGIESVKALTITSEVQPSGSEIWTQGTSGFYEDNWKYYFELDANSTAFEYGFRPTDNNALRENEDYIEIPFYYSYPSLQISNEYAYNETVCAEWMMANNYWTCQRYIQPRNEIPVAIQTDIDSFTFMIRMKLNNDSTVNCSIESNNIVCPLYKQKPKELLLIVNYVQYSNTRIRFGFSKLITYYKSSNSQLQETIENTTQQQIESQQSCTLYDKNSIVINNKYLSSTSGTEINNEAWGITNYIKIDENTKITTYEPFTSSTTTGLCFYNINKRLISCINNTNTQTNINIPNNSSYVRFSIMKERNQPQFKICKNGNQAIQDSIYNTDTSDASNSASNFFSGFTSQDNGGISSIITAPLSAISGLVSATCTPIELPLPYVNTTVILPCMSSIYEEHFGTVFSLYQTIIFGAVAYRILLSIFAMIQGFKNPDNDKIEVVDL